jgi:hypothetical protein
MGEPVHADQVASLDARVVHAQEFVSAKLMDKVKNGSVSFQWIGTSDRFWFSKTTGGSEQSFIVVDAATGTQASLFDPKAMSEALVAAGAEDKAAAPPIHTASVSGDAHSILAQTTKPGAACR